MVKLKSKIVDAHRDAKFAIVSLAVYAQGGWLKDKEKGGQHGTGVLQLP